MMRIELHTGDHEALRPLFELAEDSRAELDAYIGAGEVLVAVEGAERVGHLQLVGDEIKNMAVVETQRGRGVGRALVTAAIERARDERIEVLRVATGAADTGNLRFYQRLGFRMRSIERDAFTPANGYPPGIEVDGIELRDRVWLDLRLDAG
jgi:GNAT superfamily N-acetyltransferase